MRLGVTTLVRSMLNFNTTTIAEAGDYFAQCESMAHNKQKQSLYDGRIYPPGSEYGFVDAQAQLLGATVTIYREGIIGAIKGYIKFRKAYTILDSLIKSEAMDQMSDKFLPSGGLCLQTTRNDTSAADPEFTRRMNAIFSETRGSIVDNQSFMESESMRHETAGPCQQKDQDLDASFENDLFATWQQPELPPEQQHYDNNNYNGSDSNTLTDPMEAFVHSGVNMCLGILLLGAAIIPPTFSRVLSIVDIQGDREKGIKMIWKSTRYNNIYGVLASLILSTYYTAFPRKTRRTLSRGGVHFFSYF
jgi:hypothetical protein